MKQTKAFSIVNIVVGVILTMSGVIMFFDEETLIAAFFVLALGVAFWVVGGMTLKKAKEAGEDVSLLGKMKLVNFIFFIIGCVLMAACVILPIVGPRIG
ncbi:MAG: hypothetical protein IKS87_02695 [Lachnospiraceae bacterium]|nr:hypothetical protein [Lachnospiraceae bacterium]